MLHLERACVAALLFCPLVLAVPAAGASRLDGLEMLKQDEVQTGGFERPRSGWLDDVTSGRVDPRQQRASDLTDPISDLVMPATHNRPIVLTSSQAPPNSAVPLPTGFSLFGAALLTLGLVGLLSGPQRQPVLELGGLVDRVGGPAGAEAVPPPWFRIEVQGERGFQVRHTGSARAAIDLIADLLNEGWDVVRICDRDGLSIDYDDVIRAWRRERLLL